MPLQTKNTKRILLPILLGTLCATTRVAAESTSPMVEVSDSFRYSLTPYLWAAGITGNVDYNNGKHTHAHLSSNTVLNNLAMGGMLDAEVHYGRFGLMGNAVYAKLSNSGSKSYLHREQITVDSNSDSWMGIYTVAGSYTAYADPKLYLDIIAGARFLNLNAKVQLDASLANTPLSVEKTLYSSTSVTDAIGGIKGRLRIGETSYFVPFYLDAGGSSSMAKFTSQQMLGIGYAFKDADILLAYNNLYYSFRSDQATSYLNLSGPMIGATFRF